MIVRFERPMLGALLGALSFALLMSGPALGQSPGSEGTRDSQPGGQGLSRWLYEVDSDIPFKYYGFGEAVAKYFRNRFLLIPPDRGDTTEWVTVTDRSERRAALQAQIAELKEKLNRSSSDLKELTTQISTMKKKREGLGADLAAAKVQLTGTSGKPGDGSVSDNANVWNSRQVVKKRIEELTRRKGRLSAQINQTAARRFDLMQKDKLKYQIASLEATLAGVDDSESSRTIYLVSYRPFMIVAAVASVGLLALTFALGHLGGGVVGLGLALAFSGALHLLVAVLRSQLLLQPAAVFESGVSLTAGFAALLVAQRLARTSGRFDPDEWTLKFVATTLLGVSAILLGYWFSMGALSWSGAGAMGGYLVGKLFDAMWVCAWVYLTLKVLDMDLNPVLQILAITVAILFAVQLSILSPWLGFSRTIGTFAAGALLAAGTIAHDRSLRGVMGKLEADLEPSEPYHPEPDMA